MTLKDAKRYLEAIRGLLRRDSVSETDRETDRRHAEQVALELEAAISGCPVCGRDFVAHPDMYHGADECLGPGGFYGPPRTVVQP